MTPQLTESDETELFFEEVLIAFSMSYGVPIAEAEGLVRRYYASVRSSAGDDYFPHEGVAAVVWEVHAVAADGLVWGEKPFHDQRQTRNAANQALPSRFAAMSPVDRRDIFLRQDALREARGGGSGWLP